MGHVAPHLPLHLSRSPLLPSLATADTGTDSFAEVFMKRNMSFLPSLGFDNRRRATDPDPPITPISSLHYADRREKEAYSLPISAKQIISLLNLLEHVDDDVAGQVQRVKEGIKETYVLVDEYKKERETKERERTERHEREKRETKQVDSEFWLGV